MRLMRAITPWRTSLVVVLALQTATAVAPRETWGQNPPPVPYPTAPEPVPYGESASPGTSSAQREAAPWQDTIVMKNGGLLRGTIVDAIPDAQARIQLATGEIATVPWGAIERIERGRSAPRPGVDLPPLPPSAAAPGREATSSVLVRVHIDGPEGARLEVQTAADGPWETACEAPCDVQVPVSGEYRIAGSGIRDSKAFHLRGQQGDSVVVTVNAGSKAWLVLGIVITPIGGLVMLVGSLVGLAGSISASPANSGCTGGTCAQSTSNGSNVATAGWVTALFGAAALVGGILLIVNNARTDVAVDFTGAQNARVQGDAWAHVPTWHLAAADDPALPPIFGASLWTGHF